MNVKKWLYVVFGALAVFVLVFNPVIMGWFTEESEMIAKEALCLAVAGTPAPSKPLYNLWTSCGLPLVLYGGKMAIDYFFKHLDDDHGE
jgi:hypothetical protein